MALQRDVLASSPHRFIVLSPYRMWTGAFALMRVLFSMCLVGVSVCWCVGVCRCGWVVGLWPQRSSVECREEGEGGGGLLG
jgi:hypothetical protein